MAPYFFRVEHDLLRSESFKALGGSAIKVYLVIGLYSDFGTDWAYPSIRTIARQAGLSRQTVLVAIEELCRRGLLATSKSKGRSTAYRIIREAPTRPAQAAKKGSTPGTAAPRGKIQPTATRGRSGRVSLGEEEGSGQKSLDLGLEAGPESGPDLVRSLGPSGQESRPYPEPASREDTTSIPIPGTPFRLSAEGRLLVAVDLQELLTNQGIPRRLAEKIAAQKDPEAVAKVLLNALYLQSQGKLQNGPGYIRAGIEEGYDLLPQVADRLASRRRELEAHLRSIETKRARQLEESARAEEEAAIDLVINSLRPAELEDLLLRALQALPEPIVRRNPTLSNPFVRGKVYELACGEPLS
jgi:hypothetical protein